MTKYNKGKQRSFNRFYAKLMTKRTPAELAFESLLKTMGIKFKQQKGFLRKHETFLIADFYLQKPYRVVIELDGGYHFTPEQRAKDLEREAFLRLHRYHVLRFNNEDVLTKPEWVLEKTKEFIEKAAEANKSARLRKDRPVLLEVTYDR